MASNVTSAIVSAVIGSLAAFVTCIIFFYFVYQPFQPVDANPPPTPDQIPATIPDQEIPNPEINADQVTSIGITTVYKDYFDAGNKCAKTYNEYFGNDDGVYSSSSPCTLNITFDKTGGASRSIEIKRWDKAAKEMRIVEGSVSFANITPEQFRELAQTVVTNEAFRSWREGTMITVSNCSIKVVHSGGIKTVMSNVDEKTAVFLQLVDVFRQLEKQLRWDRAQ